MARPKKALQILLDFENALLVGMPSNFFLERYEEIIPYIHASAEWSDDFSNGRGDFKRLKDEIGPIVCFLRANNLIFEKVKFTQHGDPIDCVLTGNANVRVAVQITGTFGNDRYRLNDWRKEHKDSGGDEWSEEQLRASIGVPDTPKGMPNAHNAAEEERDRILSKPREMRCTDAILTQMRNSIKTCMDNKSDPKGASVLVISAPLLSLPIKRWTENREFLSQPCREPLTKFDEVHLVSETLSYKFSLRLH